MTPLFNIGDGLTVRAVMDHDHALIQQWIDADPEHRGRVTLEFFTAQTRYEECFMVEDEAGPVFVLKTTRAIRLDIQFGPPEERGRMRHGLFKGFPWLKRMLDARGFAEVIFETRNQRLARSMEKRLLFKRSPGEMVRGLGRSE